MKRAESARIEAGDDTIGRSRDGFVTTVTIRRPPHNYVDVDLLRRIADTFAQLDGDPDCRAIVLAADGKTFCAGADFASALQSDKAIDPGEIYREAMRLFDGRKPIVAAIQGAAIGAGAGLALVADFRIACNEARFSVNFNRLGCHPGFGLSVTLARLVGMQQASLLFYTGRRIDGAYALRIGLVDEIVALDKVRARALELAHEIAASSPLAVQSTRQTLRENLAAKIRRVNARELAEQVDQFASLDFREGVQAMTERRLPRFRGR
jgi:enoyl-CoA hydratase/carnithine racemase